MFAESEPRIPQKGVEELLSQEELLEVVKTGATTYIASADAKATGLLAVAGALLALLVALAGAEHLTPGIPSSLFALFAGLLSGSVVASAMVLLPRTTRTAYLGVAAQKSPTYFEDIVTVGLGDFQKMCEGGLDRKRFLEDATEQAFIVAAIAHTKLWWMKWSVRLLILSLLVLLVIILTRIFG